MKNHSITYHERGSNTTMEYEYENATRIHIAQTYVKFFFFFLCILFYDHVFPFGSQKAEDLQS